ncbi:radical SAM protein [Facklamia hominis]
MTSIYDFYPKEYYTPMPEMHNESIPVTAGCNYNSCKFCDLNGLLKYQEFELADIKHYIKERAKFYEGKRYVPKKFTLLEGNALCVPTQLLLEIMHCIHDSFPQVDYISTFARSKDILDKPLKDLALLKEAGLDRISIGIESGSDQVLHFQRKGVTANHQLQALKKLEALDIHYTCYIMVGLGGQELSQEHADKTAAFLNQVQPDELTVVTMVLFKGADLVKDVISGRFKRLKPSQTVLEEIRLLEKLDLKSIFNASHPTNLIPVKGMIPQQKDVLIQKLKEGYLTSLEATRKTDYYQGRKWHQLSKESGLDQALKGQ